MDSRPVVVKIIEDCTRCGETHENVTSHALVKPHAPKEAEPTVWTHWAPCPTNGQPILIRFLEEPT